GGDDATLHRQRDRFVGQARLAEPRGAGDEQQASAFVERGGDGAQLGAATDEVGGRAHRHRGSMGDGMGGDQGGFLRRSPGASPQRQRRRDDGLDERDEDDVAAPPSRLTRALRTNRWKDAALVETLVNEAASAPWQKQQAWLQAVRELGGERATAMWARAF